MSLNSEIKIQSERGKLVEWSKETGVVSDSVSLNPHCISSTSKLVSTL